MLVISAVRRSLHGLQRDIMAFTTPRTVSAAGTRFFKGYTPLDWEASPTNSWDEQLSRRYIMYSALHFHPIRCLNLLQTPLLPNSFQPIFSFTPLVSPHVASHTFSRLFLKLLFPTPLIGQFHSAILSSSSPSIFGVALPLPKTNLHK